MIKYPSKKVFEKLLAEYQQVPVSKKLLYSMVRFENMCRRPGASLTFLAAIPGFGDPYGVVETARARRAEIYNTSKDLVKTVDAKEGKVLILTSKGHKVFFEKYPLARLRQKPWDGNWTLVSYDVPSNREANYLRDRLRRCLRNFGFGQLHQSMMVSPLPLEEPVQEFIEGERLREFVVVMVSRRLLGFSDQEIARRAYNLEKLQSLYEELEEKFEKAREKKSDLKRWTTYYLAVDNADPQLPDELLPDGWSGKEVRRKFNSSFSLFERIFSR